MVLRSFDEVKVVCCKKYCADHWASPSCTEQVCQAGKALNPALDATELCIASRFGSGGHHAEALSFLIQSLTPAALTANPCRASGCPGLTQRSYWSRLPENLLPYSAFLQGACKLQNKAAAYSYGVQVYYVVPRPKHSLIMSCAEQYVLRPCCRSSVMCRKGFKLGVGDGIWLLYTQYYHDVLKKIVIYSERIWKLVSEKRNCAVFPPKSV